MALVIAGMTMSLDGYVNDRDGSVSALYADLADLPGTQGEEYMSADASRTGAVVMGRRSYEGAEDPDSYADDYEFQVPLFVVTHEAPAVAPRSNDRLSITFVTDGVREAVARARDAAGDKDVTVVGGADLVRQLLDEDLVDELHVDVVPVLLGGGLRLFEGVGTRRLQKAAVLEVGARTSLRFRVPATG